MLWLVLVACFYCTGIIFSEYFVQCDFLWLGFFILPFLYIWIKRNNKEPYVYGMAIMPFVFLLSIYWTDYKSPKPLSYDISYSAPLNKTIVEGEIADEPVLKEKSVSFIFRVTGMAGSGKKSGGLTMVKVKLDPQKTQFEYSQHLKLKGSLFLPQESTGSFSYKEYLQRRGIFSQMIVKDAKDIIYLKNDSKDILYKIFQVRNHIFDLYKQYMPANLADFTGSLVFGSKASSVDKDTQDKFRKLGISHVLAASGFQVTLLLAVCLYLGKLIGKEKLHSKIIIITISAIILSLYIIMTGAPPSIQRAGAVGFLTITGIIIGRNPDPLPALVLAGLMILIYSPLTFYDIGFQMSVLATFALIYTVPLLVDKWKFLTTAGATLIAVPIAAQLWVLPIQLHYFGQFSWLFLPANIVSALFVSFLSYLGFISAAIGFILPVTLILLCPVMAFISNLYLYTVDLLALIPNAVFYTANISILSVILSFILLFALIEWIKRYGTNHKPFELTAYLTAALMIGIYSSSTLSSADLLSVTFLPVGNGDSCVIRTPCKNTILIDGGPVYEDFNAGERYVIPYLRQSGINSVDLMILTHPDYDHVGGLPAVIENIDVKTIIDTDHTDDSDEYNKFLSDIIYRDISYNKVYRGYKYIIEPDLELDILNPPQGVYLEKNNKSVVVRMIYKNVIFLFSGDIGFSAEEDIMKNIPDLKADVLKVAHHGSKNSSGIEFLRKVNPEIAVICVGKRNRFKHPNKITLARLNEINARILRTDQNGQITINTDGYEIETN